MQEKPDQRQGMDDPPGQLEPGASHKPFCLLLVFAPLSLLVVSSILTNVDHRNDPTLFNSEFFGCLLPLLVAISTVFLLPLVLGAMAFLGKYYGPALFLIWFTVFLSSVAVMVGSSTTANYLNNWWVIKRIDEYAELVLSVDMAEMPEFSGANPEELRITRCLYTTGIDPLENAPHLSCYLKPGVLIFSLPGNGFDEYYELTSDDYCWRKCYEGHCIDPPLKCLKNPLTPSTPHR